MNNIPKLGERWRVGVDVTVEGEVVYVGRVNAVIEKDDGDLVVRYFTTTWAKVEPRPTIAAEQWGWIEGGLYCNEVGTVTEAGARLIVGYEQSLRTLARIIDGRVCDEHGVPFDVEPRP